MSGRAAFGAVAVAAGVYLYWQSRSEGQQQGGAQPVSAAPSQWQQAASYSASDRLSDLQAAQAPQQSGGSSMKFNFGPLLQWGIGQLSGLFGQSGNGQGPGRPPSGGGSGGGTSYGGATATEDGATAGGPSPHGSHITALQRVIGDAEAPEGYNQVYGGSRLQPPRPITTMTVAEVREWQNRSVNAGSPSSAAGRYQIIGPTLQSLIDEGAVSPSDTFDSATQDRLSVALMERRGLRDFEAGRLSPTQFAQRLSQEWAGLPAFTRDRRGRSATGQSYYAGDGLNAATTTQDRVMRALTGSGGWV